jgi:hypothetical protein
MLTNPTEMTKKKGEKVPAKNAGLSPLQETELT